jgi:hypothetical protein
MPNREVRRVNDNTFTSGPSGSRGGDHLEMHMYEDDERGSDSRQGLTPYPETRGRYSASEAVLDSSSSRTSSKWPSFKTSFF